MQSLTATDQKDRRSQGNKHPTSACPSGLKCPADVSHWPKATGRRHILTDTMHKEPPLWAQSREGKGRR